MLPAFIEEPVVTEKRFDADNQVRKKVIYGRMKVIEFCPHVLMQQDITPLVHDANIHPFFMQVDAAVILRFTFRKFIGPPGFGFYVFVRLLKYNKEFWRTFYIISLLQADQNSPGFWFPEDDFLGFIGLHTFNFGGLSSR